MTCTGGSSGSTPRGSGGLSTAAINGRQQKSSATNLVVHKQKNGSTIVRPSGGGGGSFSPVDDDTGLRRNGSDSYEKAKNRTVSFFLFTRLFIFQSIFCK
jgi:hypothetical protein